MLIVLGILLFGRRLPEVGRTLGRTLAQFRQGYEKLKHDINLEAEASEVAKTVQEFKREVKEPTVSANPVRMLGDLAKEAISPPEPVAPPKVPQTPASSPKASESQDQA